MSDSNVTLYKRLVFLEMLEDEMISELSQTSVHNFTVIDYVDNILQKAMKTPEFQQRLSQDDPSLWSPATIQSYISQFSDFYNITR